MMKLTTSILLMAAFVLNFNAKAQTAKDYTVQAWAVTDKSKPSITLKWPKIATGVTAYTIYRKSKDAIAWGSIKGTAAGTDTAWVDTDVKIGQVYEYNILKMDGNNTLGVTYLLGGIEVPLVHNRGNCLVLVEKALASQISTELTNYLNDIAADGWKVYTLQVNKTDSVQKVRREVFKINTQSGGLKSLVILGHVPVPYSGDFGQNQTGSAPDGHVPDHNGAWPTDSYYSIITDQWEDLITNTDGSRAENKNVPGDSKWDNTFFPGTIQFYTGRVDLSNMPKFTKTEAELTKQYFKKAHDFRYKITTTVEKGVLEDNFGGAEGFSSTGWRNFSVMFGPSNIIADDYFTTCQTQNLLFAYACGAGSYTSCGGVGTTDDFTTKKGAIFNMLFGSYFGDWDNANNFLRAPLAASENGLTNAWSGRPWWNNHQMALGEPIGYCTMITQNNQGTYESNFMANSVPIGLMGDPTLRLHMIAPPTNVTATATTNNTKVDLSWTASSELQNLGYYVYRSGNSLSNNFPINSTPLTTTTFTDNAPYQGTNYYLVKTVKLTTSASGSYFNLSYGAPASVSGITGLPANLELLTQQNISIYPNPAKQQIVLAFTNYLSNNVYEIINGQGQLVKTGDLSLNSNLKSQSIDISELSNGLYIIKAGNTSNRFIKY